MNRCGSPPNPHAPKPAIRPSRHNSKQLTRDQRLTQNYKQYGEDEQSVSWLPDYATHICYYRSKQVQVYEFKISPENFKLWAESNGMQVQRLSKQEILSRYKAYLPVDRKQQDHPISPDGPISIEQFEAWKAVISIKINEGLIAQSSDESTATAIYDPATETAYFENLIYL